MIGLSKIPSHPKCILYSAPFTPAATLPAFTAGADTLLGSTKEGRMSCLTSTVAKVT